MFLMLILSAQIGQYWISLKQAKNGSENCSLHEFTIWSLTKQIQVPIFVEIKNKLDANGMGLVIEVFNYRMHKNNS